MADFPDNMEASLRNRFALLGVRPDEVSERFIRGTGAGGQKINKTSSTVSLRHEPTGIEVRCQRERSQAVNRRLAWLELAGRLEARQAGKQREQTSAAELVRRQTRQKSRRQNARMLDSKRHRTRTKSSRGRVAPD